MQWPKRGAVTAYSCGAVADFHRLPVHSARSLLKVDPFLGRNSFPVRMLDLAHLRYAICGRDEFVRCVATGQHNMHMRWPCLQTPNDFIGRDVPVTQNVI